MGRAAGGGPGGTQVGQFGLQALDLQPQRRPAGESKRDHAGRGVGLGEFDRLLAQHSRKEVTARVDEMLDHGLLQQDEHGHLVPQGWKHGA